MPEEKQSRACRIGASDAMNAAAQISMVDPTETTRPPSFAQSEFETIIRKQRTKQPHGLKVVDSPSRYPNLDNQWEFAGWGTMSYLDISEERISQANARISKKPPTVGQFRGTSLPGNGMTSSVYYAFPAVVAASSIYSPICLLIACLIIFLWRPIFLELGSAIRLNGGNYSYLLQVSGKSLGLLGAAATALDSVATSAVSAAAAASYLRGEFGALPLKEASITIILLCGLALLCFLNVGGSSSFALSFFLIHMISMAVLMTACAISWAREGSDVLKSNWDLRPRGTANISRNIFNGICVGFLGVTGFETTPSFIEVIRPNVYSKVLRNALVCTLLLNAPLILLVYAILPEQTISSQANILSILAERVAGRWLRIFVVVDCVLVLFGGVLGGIYSCCALIEGLARDRLFPQELLKTLPVTGAPYISIICCLALNILLYASSAFRLATISAVFTVSFLTVLLMFVISNLLLKFNRDRLTRTHNAGVLTLFFTFALTLILLAGNVAQDPRILGLFAIYFVVTLIPLFAIRAKSAAGYVLMWLYGQLGLHKYPLTQGWDAKIVNAIKRAGKDPICVWVRRDEIHNMVDIILYIQRNETTSRIIFIHAYRQIESIPSELAPNTKILDEAFPATTVDLVFVRGTFGPSLVEAVSARLDIPRSKMFMSCPGKNHGWELADYQGVRVVKF